MTSDESDPAGLNELWVKKQQTVPELLKAAAATFEERNSVYGNTYHHHGNVLQALFPDGVDLSTTADFKRFGLLNMCVGKLIRYARNFDQGGHADSLHDLINYVAMLSEVDSNGKHNDVHG